MRLLRLGFQLCLVAVVAAGQLAAQNPGDYDEELIEHQTPPRLQQLQIVDVPIVLENHGSRAWIPGRFNVSYHWLSQDGEMLDRDGLRTPIPEEVGPGEEIRLIAKLQGPRQSGTFRLQWDVVEESVTWISEKDPSPPASIPVSIVPGEFTHAFSIVHEDSPHLLLARRTTFVTLTVRNDGTVAWGPGREINVSYHWDHDDEGRRVFEGIRTPIETPVGSGETVELAAELRAPRDSGLYRLKWDMVEENVTWFRDVDPTAPPPITVLVLPNPFQDPSGATLAAVLCLALLLVIVRRPVRREWLFEIATLLDLAWLFIALMVKQSAVLDTAGKSLAQGAGWIVASGVAAITIVAALLPARIRVWTVAAVNLFASVLILTDVVHLRFFSDVLSLASFGAAGQTGQILESVGALLRWHDLWLFADLIPGVVLCLLIHLHVKRFTTRFSRWLAVLLVPLLVPGFLAVLEISRAQKGMFVQVFQNTIVVRQIGPLNYHVFDALKELRTVLSSPELSEQRRDEIVEWYRTTAPRRAGVGEMFGISRGKNLIMIQVESMQGFVIGLKVDGQEITPNLNRWSRSNAIWLSNCNDQTAQGRTSDAEFAINTSLIPLRHGTVAFRYAQNTYEGLADVLHDHGYETLSAIPFGRAFWNRRVTMPEYGYRTNLFKEDFKPGLRIGWGLNDRDFLDQMAPKLASLKRPFGALLITLSNHHPYVDFPDELKELDFGELEGTSLGNYLHGIHYFDSAMANFVEKLEQNGLLGDTLIALWGDHGAGLPWNYEMGDLIGVPPTEPMFYKSLEVPVLISVPGAESFVGERTIRCGQVDLAPTLLALLGIDPAPYPFIGRNLFGEPGEGPVISHYSVWLDDEHLYLDKGPELEAGRCYDVDSLRIVPVERCREGDRRAKQKMQVSRDVIIHDLQGPIAEALGAPTRVAAGE